VEAHGIPLAVAVDGANRHDMKLTKPTLENILLRKPRSKRETTQNICADKGYDYPEVRELLQNWKYTIHIPSRGEDVKARRKIPSYRARHWVVERTHSWMNRFRRLLIRWEKKVENYLAMLHLACAWITYHATGLFG
jgi:putative transposase